MSDRVADYRGLVESLAAKLANSRAARDARAEYDDLVQEGLIDVWLALDGGRHPGEEGIRRRMVDWIRRMGRQRRGETSLEGLLAQAEAADAAEASGLSSFQTKDMARLVQDQE